jgi:hypothetical protein
MKLEMSNLDRLTKLAGCCRTGLESLMDRPREPLIYSVSRIDSL